MLNNITLVSRLPMIALMLSGLLMAATPSHLNGVGATDSQERVLVYQLEAINKNLKSIIIELIGVDKNNVIADKVATAVLRVVPEMIKRMAVIANGADEDSVVSRIGEVLKLEQLLPILHANCVIIEKQLGLQYSSLKNQYQTTFEYLRCSDGWKTRLSKEQLEEVADLEITLCAVNKFKWRLYLLNKITKTADFISTHGKSIAVGAFGLSSAYAIQKLLQK